MSNICRKVVFFKGHTSSNHKRWNIIDKISTISFFISTKVIKRIYYKNEKYKKLCKSSLATDTKVNYCMTLDKPMYLHFRL